MKSYLVLFASCLIASLIVLSARADIPDGWSKVGDGGCPGAGCTFDVDLRSDIKLCDITYLTCSSVITLLKNPGVHYLCTIENFKDFPIGVDPYVCISKPNPLPLPVADLPKWGLDTWNNVKRISVPADVSDQFTEAVVWKGSSGKIHMAYGTYLELASAYAQGFLRNNTVFNNWLGSIQLEEMTEKENAFAISTIKATTFPPNPVLTTLDTRLYWVASSRDFNILPVVGSIAIGVQCDPDQSITNSVGTYYVVPSQDPSVKWTGATHLRVYAKCTVF